MDMKQRRSVYELYIVSWSGIGDAERQRILEETVSEDVTYLDASTRRSGRAELAANLAGFQQRRPGFSFGLGNLLVYQDVGLANWKMLDTSGGVVVDGYDVLRFDAEGRMSHVTGFSDAPSQRAI